MVATAVLKVMYRNVRHARLSALEIENLGESQSVRKNQREEGRHWQTLKELLAISPNRMDGASVVKPRKRANLIEDERVNVPTTKSRCRLPQGPNDRRHALDPFYAPIPIHDPHRLPSTIHGRGIRLIGRVTRLIHREQVSLLRT